MKDNISKSFFGPLFLNFAPYWLHFAPYWGCPGYPLAPFFRCAYEQNINDNRQKWRIINLQLINKNPHDITV